MAAKLTELKKLIALLDEEHEDVEVLAKEIWNLVEQLQQSREQYILLAYHPDINLWQSAGPYATRNQAMKAFEKNRFVSYDGKAKGAIALLQAP
jgi:hypothetical protein